jgi:hypothetical protein
MRERSAELLPAKIVCGSWLWRWLSDHVEECISPDATRMRLKQVTANRELCPERRARVPAARVSLASDFASYWPRGEAPAATSVPIASPDNTSSTRRLRWRPSGVSLLAMGCIFPNPRTVTAGAGTP